MHGSISSSSARLPPDGTPLRNRLLASLPSDADAPITEHLQMQVVVTARTLQEHGTPVTHVTRSRGASRGSRNTGARPHTPPSGGCHDD